MYKTVKCFYIEMIFRVIIEPQLKVLEGIFHQQDVYKKLE